MSFQPPAVNEPRRRSFQIAASLLALVVLIATAWQIVPSLVPYANATTGTTAQVPAPPPGFTLTWADDFNDAANTGLNTDNWRYDAGAGANFGTGEIEETTTSTQNVYHDGAGNVVLRALHTGTDPNTGWTSGRFETQGDGWGAPAGGVVRFESRIRQPNITTANGAGYWPAFWMVGSPLRIAVPWPGSGEIDVLEDINGRTSHFSTLHCGVLPTGPCNEYTGIGSGEQPCSGCANAFRVYAVEIDRSVQPEQIRFYLDNVNFYTINSSQVDATTWNNAIHHNFTPIYDLAIGGQFPAAYGGGPNAATVSGAHLDVDYLAIYNKAPAGQAGWGTDVARGKVATASSAESALFGAGNVVDGNPTTRWGSAFSDPQWVQVDLGQAYNINHVSLNWEAACAAAYQIQTSTNGTTWTTVYNRTGGTSEQIDVPVTASARYVRVNGTARASQWGYSLYDLKVYSTSGTTPSPSASPSQTGGTLLSQGQPATASSVENASFTAPMAVDGNVNTRWSSAFSDPQWLQVDLGASHTLNHVVLNWEAAYATAYQIQISTNGTTWTTAYSTTTSTGGIQTVPVSGTARYVRMNGTARATQWGYSLLEFQVYGS
ncbi:galactose-binding domain-containing protein [Hamadaea tsunoensis]|uniref:galactose-binding domain-containing protein n=1 Tax=Hamadaea tsunoensis TaxID=53368 RepID=UPI000417E944|nr:discoidin domain-containing protein [Hamadaea tsunoensis]